MSKPNKYLRWIRPKSSASGQKPIQVDIYNVLDAYQVKCPATEHAIKKLLCAGLRGKGDRLQDLTEAIQAIERAVEMEKDKDSVLPGRPVEVERPTNQIVVKTNGPTFPEGPAPGTFVDKFGNPVSPAGSMSLPLIHADFTFPPHLRRPDPSNVGYRKAGDTGPHDPDGYKPPVGGPTDASE